MQKQLNIKVMSKINEIKKYYRERQRVVKVLKSCETRNHIDIAINYLKAFKNKWLKLIDNDLSMYIKYKQFEQDFYKSVVVMETKMV